MNRPRGRHMKLAGLEAAVLLVCCMIALSPRAARPRTGTNSCSAASDSAAAVANIRAPFDAATDGDVLALADESQRATFEASLEDAGRNWFELADCVKMLEDEERAAGVRLINEMPHLDRLEMRAETLDEHVRYAFKTLTEMPYEVPAEMFEPYILTYRIADEPVEAWREELYERFAGLADSARTVEATARAVNRRIAGSVTERERAFFGPTQSPLQTLHSGRGARDEISILTCAALKALGIPSRRVSVAALGSEDGAASWVEVFCSDGWIPLYPMEPDAFGDRSYIEKDNWRNVTVASTRSAFEDVLVTERYTDTGRIELSFVSEGQPAAGFEHFSISVLNNGALVPLDALNAVADDEGRFTAVVGNGRYVVEAGVRDEDGRPFVTMHDVTVTPGAVKRIAFDVSAGGSGRPVDVRDPRYRDAVSVWVAFDDSEPSTRMLPLIAAAVKGLSGVAEITYVYMGVDADAKNMARQTLDPEADFRTLSRPDEWFYMDDSGRRVAIGRGGVEFPVVRVYASGQNRLILMSSGYDLNIKRKMDAAINGRLKEISEK